MNPYLLSGLISSVASLGSSVISSLSGAKNTSSANKANERLLDKQNSFNVGMWNRTNQYNSVGSQAQRLSAAGFNPALALGSPTAAQPLTSASAQPTNVAPAFNAGLGEAATSFINARYQGELTKQEQLKNEQLSIDNQYRVSEKIKSLQEQQSRIDNLLSQKDINDEKKESLKVERAYNKRQLDFFNEVFSTNAERARQGLRNDQASEDNIRSEINKRKHDSIMEEARLAIEQILADSKIRVDRATISNLAAQTANLAVQEDVIRQEFEGKKLSNASTRMEVTKRLVGYKKEVSNYLKQLNHAGVINDKQYDATIAELNKIKVQNWFDEYYRYGAMGGEYQSGFEPTVIRALNYFFSQFGQALGGSGAALLKKVP